MRKFPDLVPLPELRKHAKSGGALEDLEMLKQGRLSVSAVRPGEWQFILRLASDDDLDDEPEEDLAAVRGQIVNVQEEVVRELKGGETVNGHGAESGEDGVKSKFTTTRSTGRD